MRQKDLKRKMANKEILLYKSGAHNLIDSEIIPDDASSNSNNWITIDGRIRLINGKVLEGNAGAVGAIYGEIFGYKINGDKVHWRKAGTKIQFYRDWETDRKSVV